MPENCRYALYRYYPYYEEDEDENGEGELLYLADSLPEALKVSGLFHQNDMVLSRADDENVVRNMKRTVEEEDELLNSPNMLNYYTDNEEYSVIRIVKILRYEPDFSKETRDALYIKTIACNIGYDNANKHFNFEMHDYDFGTVFLESKFLGYDLNYQRYAPDSFNTIGKDRVIVDINRIGWRNCMKFKITVCKSNADEINMLDNYIKEFFEELIKHMDNFKDVSEIKRYIYDTFDNTNRPYFERNKDTEVFADYYESREEENISE